MIIVRIVQFVKIVQLVQLDYYGYIKFFGGFVGTWVGAFTITTRVTLALNWLIPSGQVAHATLDGRLCRTRIFKYSASFGLYLRMVSAQPLKMTDYSVRIKFA